MLELSEKMTNLLLCPLQRLMQCTFVAAAAAAAAAVAVAAAACFCCCRNRWGGGPQRFGIDGVELLQQQPQQPRKENNLLRRRTVPGSQTAHKHKP